MPVTIDNLPEFDETPTLTSMFDIYVDNGTHIDQYLATFNDISAYFYTTSSFIELSAKYDEVIDLLNDFKKFIKDNYLTEAQTNALLVTEQYLKNTINQLMTIDKAKKDFLGEYCTIDYANLKKEQAYKRHESLANSLGRIRPTVLNLIKDNEELIGGEEE